MKILYVSLLFALAIFSVNLSYGQLFNSTNAHQVPVMGTNFTIPYTITGGTVTSVTTDVPSNSLKISVQPTANGSLQLVLPRLLIDSTENGQDGHLLVFANSHGVQYNEVDNSTVRILTVPITNKTNEIRIVGTQIVPEFGQLSYVVLTVSIMAMIMLFYRKNIVGIGFRTG